MVARFYDGKWCMCVRQTNISQTGYQPISNGDKPTDTERRAVKIPMLPISGGGGQTRWTTLNWGGISLLPKAGMTNKPGVR